MLNKKLMILTIILVSLLAVSAVSAADNNTSDVVGVEETIDAVSVDVADEVVNIEDNQIMGNESYEVISSSQDDGLGDGDNGTFDALKNKIETADEGSTIDLENDYIYEGKLNSFNEINISKTLTINGNGHKIDACSKSRIFVLSSDNIVLKNIVFCRSYDSAISVEGKNCTITSCYFTNCGNIGNSGVNCSITSCYFTNCYSHNDGGAIFNTGKNCSITSCYFIDCYSYHNGGSISCGKGGNCKISSCDFRNSLADYGGAVYNECKNCTIISCNFTNCSAYEGNVIYVEKEDFPYDTISNRVYAINCNFTDLNTGFAHWGEVSFFNCTFKDTINQCSIWVSPDVHNIINDKGYGSEIPVSHTTTNQTHHISEIVVPPNRLGYKIIISNGDKLLLSKSIGETAIAFYNWGSISYIYSFGLNLNGTYNDDIIRFSVFENGVEIIFEEYVICLIDDSIKFEPYNDTLEKFDPNLTINIGDVDYGNDVLVIITTNETFSGEVSVQIENVTCTVVVKNGHGNTTVPNVNGGIHTANAIFKANRLFNQSIVKTNFTVNKFDSSLNVSDVELTYGESLKVPVTTECSVGITAKIDGMDIAVDGNMVVVSGLGVGTHILSVSTIPDANHNAVTCNATITVKKSRTKVSASKVSVKYGNAKNIVVTLKDFNGKALSGKKITVKLNGVTYKGRITNSKGQVSIAVPKSLAPKTYSASISFAGDGNYNKSTGSVKVVVTKATPKITAKAKSFKKSTKTKKYTITLKNNKNKVMKNTKVTIKVNKKTYTAKTNKKGVATFKITKLTKKGKYTATVTYKGSKYYKKVTKKVKITIK